MSRTESQTRQEIIDRQLAKAGWGLNNRTLVEEHLIRIAEGEQEYHHRGFTDYTLLGRDRRPMRCRGETKQS
jgi:type I restriction enzyme, R subunit